MRISTSPGLRAQRGWQGFCISGQHLGGGDELAYAAVQPAVRVDPLQPGYFELEHPFDAHLHGWLKFQIYLLRLSLNRGKG